VKRWTKTPGKPSEETYECIPKIFGEKLAKALGRECRNRPHLIASIIDHRELRATSADLSRREQRGTEAL
jgi:hypothetical protein